jgi:hypothetical protein
VAQSSASQSYSLLSGLQISDRTAGQACPTADDGKIKMVMSGFTEATDTSFNGIYTMLPASKIVCRNISTTEAAAVSGLEAGLTDASCTDVCSQDKCIGDAGQKEYDMSTNQEVSKPFGIGALYYMEGSTDEDHRLVFLSYMGASPKYCTAPSCASEKSDRTADPAAAPTIPGSNPVWFACKYSLSTFLDKLSWPSSSGSSSANMGPPMGPAPAASYRRRLLTDDAMYMPAMGGMDEGGLNTGAANMLTDCKAAAMGVDAEPNVPVVGPDGWIRFGVGTALFNVPLFPAHLRTLLLA